MVLADYHRATGRDAHDFIRLASVVVKCPAAGCNKIIGYVWNVNGRGIFGAARNEKNTETGIHLRSYSPPILFVGEETSPDMVVCNRHGPLWIDIAALPRPDSSPNQRGVKARGIDPTWKGLGERA